MGAWSDAGKRTLLELTARGGDEGGEDAKARFNVFDSKRGGILNKGRGGTTVTPCSRSEKQRLHGVPRCQLNFNI